MRMLVLMLTLWLVLRRRMLLRLRMLRRMRCRCWMRRRVRSGMLLFCRMRVRVRRRCGFLRVLLRSRFFSVLRNAARRFAVRCLGRMLRLGLRVLTFRCMLRRSTGLGRPRVMRFRLSMLGRFALRTRHTVLVPFVSLVRARRSFGLRLRGCAIRRVRLLFSPVRRLNRLRFIAVSRRALRTDRVDLRPVDHAKACRGGHRTRFARMCRRGECSGSGGAHHRFARTRHFAAARGKALRERVVIGRRHDWRTGRYDLALR